MASPCDCNNSLWSARIGDAKLRCARSARDALLKGLLEVPGNASTQTLAHGKNFDTLSNKRAKQRA
jgi:hypothetical protein